MSRSKSSSRWLKEHFSDPYVKKAKQEGYRARAAYKLLEIQQKDHLFKPGMVVVDLGAAPGGWSQVVKDLVGEKGRIIALDILPMDPISGVECLQGDFEDAQVIENLHKLVGEQKIDLVISDLAPNMSGIASVDQARAMRLVESALLFAQQVLKPGGTFLIKAFQGAGFDNYLRDMRRSFDKIVIRKPQASRQRSSEIYLLARGYKLL